MQDRLTLLLEPRSYIPNFLKIRTKEAKLVKLEAKTPQLKLLDVVEKCKGLHRPIRVIILKARQMGFSTYVEALIFNDEVTHNLKNGMIIAHEDKASQNLFQMYRTYYENLPTELTPMTKYSNTQEILFENPSTDIAEKKRNPGLQSRIAVSTAKNVSSGRSATIHNLHASEVAFWDNAKTLMTGLLQSVPETENSSVYIESTANGVGGWFYNMWNDAVAGRNSFIPLFFAWFDEPTYTRLFYSDDERLEFIKQVNFNYTDKDGRIINTEEKELMEEHHLTFEQLNWRKYAIANQCAGDIETFHQEYPSTPDEAFISSGRPKFSITDLKLYKKKCKRGTIGFLSAVNGRIVFTANPKGYIEIWDEPKDSEFYCIGADVAEGLAKGDFSAAFVGDSDFNVVAKWHGHIEPDLYGDELVKLAKYYNEAYIGVERNNHGLTTLMSIRNKDYYNIFFSKTYDKITDVITQKIGWETTPRTKPMMIDKLAEYIREHYLQTYDDMFVSEAVTYMIEDNGATNAQEGCYDDCVMAMGILLQLLLEGKGDTFVPFVPKEGSHGTINRGEIKTRADEDDEKEKNSQEIAI